MNVLIAGGAGYIGSITVKKLLEEGHTVVVLDNLEKGHLAALDLKQVKFVQADLRRPSEIEQALNQFQVEACIHFAAYCAAGESAKKPFEYFENNVFGSLNLFNALVKRKILRLVFSSTCAIYGQPQRLPVKEGDPEKPESPYGESKLMVEKTLSWFAKAYGLNAIALRYFNAAGAYPDGSIGEDKQPATNLIPAAIEAALGKREKFVLHGDDYETSDGSCIRDYIHVLDLAKAHLKALEKLKTGFAGFAFYNCGAGKGYSNLEIINKIKKVSMVEFPVEIGPKRPGDPAAIYADNSLIKKELGWSPQLNLDQIVESAWRWHLQHPDGYKS